MTTLGIEAAASGMMAQQLNIDVISNNLANANTVGFKQFIPIFKNISDNILKEKSKKDDNLSEDKTIGTLSSGSVLDSTILDLQQATLKKTDNKLDFALDGNGFFAVSTPNGDCYTRNGSFVIDDKGSLITKDGNSVLNKDGAPIIINLNNTNTPKTLDKLNVTEDGTIFLGKEEIGKLKIAAFSKPEDLTSLGNSLYKPVDNNIKPTEAQNCKVNQGFTEGSNSSVIENMINTISATRTYETLSKIVKTTEMTLSKAVNDVGRLKE